MLNLEKLSQWIRKGKVPTDEIITMKTLRDSGVVGKKVKHGVKVLGRGAASFKHRVHLQVSKCSIEAEKAIERSGGTVRMVYYDKTGLRALLKPHAYVKKGLMIPPPARYVPSKRIDAYDFPGDTQPKTQIDETDRHFQTPKRKEPGHPGLPEGTGHIKTRQARTILIDYGKKARKKRQEEENAVTEKTE